MASTLTFLGRSASAGRMTSEKVKETVSSF